MDWWTVTRSEDAGIPEIKELFIVDIRKLTYLSKNSPHRSNRARQPNETLFAHFLGEADIPYHSSFVASILKSQLS